MDTQRHSGLKSRVPWVWRFTDGGGRWFQTCFMLNPMNGMSCPICQYFSHSAETTNQPCSSSQFYIQVARTCTGTGACKGCATACTGCKSSIDLQADLGFLEDCPIIHLNLAWPSLRCPCSWWWCVSKHITLILGHDCYESSIKAVSSNWHPIVNLIESVV